MGNDDSDDRIEQLRARVAQLEQQVPDGPTRRQVLAGGGLLGLGGLLGGGATEQVRAQQAAGQVGTESEPVDVYGATGEFGSVKAVDATITQGHGFLGLPNHHVNYESGLNNEEISRFSLAAGDVLEVWRLEAQLKTGGTNSNVTLGVYDVTNSTSLGSVTAGSRSDGGSSPLGTSGAGATILVRLSTGSSAVNLCNTGITSVVSQ